MGNYSYIYGLLCPYDNIIKYVGQSTQNPRVRLYQHLRNDRKYNDAKTTWINKVKRLNLKDKVEIVILEKCDKILLNEREKYWIKHFINEGIKLKNSTEGGDYNYTFTEETKQKISNKLKGRPGIKHTEETKRKISENRKGQKLSEETKKIISEKLKGKNAGINNYMFGKHHTEEWKKKQSEKLKGKYTGENSFFYGKKHSEECKKIMSEKKKGKMNGADNHFYGKKHSEETKKMISDMQMDIILKPFYALDKELNIVKLFKKRSDVFAFLNIKENNTRVYNVMNKGELYKGYYFIRKEGFVETFFKLFGRENENILE